MTHMSRAVLALFAIALSSLRRVRARSPTQSLSASRQLGANPGKHERGQVGRGHGVKPGPMAASGCCTAASMSCRPGSGHLRRRDDMPPIMKFDPSGKLLESFGQGLLAFPHGFHVDGDSNIWVTDANNQASVLASRPRAAAIRYSNSTRTARFC